MMLSLIGDIPFDIFEIGITDRKRAVAGLPGEVLFFGKRFVNPFGRVALDETQSIGYRKRFAERCEKMNVVRHTAGCEQRAFFTAEDSADVFVQTRLEIRRDRRRSVFCAENNVQVQTHK